MFKFTILVGFFLGAGLSAQVARNHDVPLKNWAVPLYWQPTQAESEAGRMQAEIHDPSPKAATPAGSLVFVAMTPCRVVDTRFGMGFTGAFGPPSLAGGLPVRTIPIQSTNACPIPSIAQAYSFNVTVVPQATLGYLTLYPATAGAQPPPPNVSTLNSLQGIVVANAAIVPAGTDGHGGVDVYASNPTDLIIDMNGYYAPSTGITLAQGTASAPSLSFSGDTGTGIFSMASGTMNLAGNVGIGSSGPPGQKLHIGDGNILIEGGAETAIKIKRDITIMGGPSGTSNHPIFECGRIIQAGDGDPEFRCLYSDDGPTPGNPTPERSVFEFDRKGIVASVKQDFGSHFEGFVDSLCPTPPPGDTRSCEPMFRLNSSPLNSSPKMRLEMGAGGRGNLVDVAVQREDVSTLTLRTGGTERLRVDSAGNVGVGTIMARDTLEVNGEVRVANCVKNSTGSPIAGTCLSDARLKTNIQPFAPVLARLVHLQPVHFDWRSAEYPDYHFGSSQSYGLIAQEVEQAYPELVAKDQRGFLAVNYSELPLVLLQAVRELKAENDHDHAQLKIEEEQNRQNTEAINSLQTTVFALQKAVQELMSSKVPKATVDRSVMEPR